MLLKWWEGLVALVILKATCWQVSGERPSMWGGGGEVLDNSLTLWPCMLQGKQQKLTCKTNLSVTYNFVKWYSKFQTSYCLDHEKYFLRLKHSKPSHLF